MIWGDKEQGLSSGLLLEAQSVSKASLLAVGMLLGKLRCSLLVAASLYPCLRGPVAFFLCVSLDPNLSLLRRTTSQWVMAIPNPFMAF